jgi:predicted negative regulator of RcsB-dependent stress response
MDKFLLMVILLKHKKENKELDSLENFIKDVGKLIILLFIILHFDEL